MGAAILTKAVTIPTTWPFKIFSQKRYTMQEVLNMIREGYTFADSAGHLPPLFDSIIDTLSSFYSYEICWKAYLDGDVFWYGSSIQDEITAGLADGTYVSVEAYADDAEESGIPFEVSRDNSFGGEFIDDIEYALNVLGLHYVLVDYDDVYTYANHQAGTPLPDPHKVHVRNNPIIEVW